jgi:hypothetical protein
MKMQNCLLIVAAALLVAPVGCSTLSKSPSAEAKKTSFFDRVPWPGKKKKDEAEEKYPTPVKLAATWTPDTLVQTGRTPTRGFGGRIFFYDEKSRAIPVNGALVVHGFDETAAKVEDRVKRFEFTPEQFTRHFSQTDLGASYSVWVPWDAVGGEQRRISLVASFKNEDGKTVQGIPATIQLPGITEKTPEEELAKFSPQYRKYREASESPSAHASGLVTTTIPRRSASPANDKAGRPGLEIPAVYDPESMVAAEEESTPSVDVEMFGKRSVKRSPTVLPASAQVPIEKR